MTAVTALVAVGIAIGLIGILVPVLPGLALIVLSVGVWAVAAADPVGWWVVAGSIALAALGWGLQYVVPGRRLRNAGIPTSSTVAGVLAGLLGFVVIPVLGLPLGFVAGVYLAEACRRGPYRAWPTTRHAVIAALTSYGIEFTTGLLIAATWTIGAWRVLT